jgi:hypothetical protein
MPLGEDLHDDLAGPPDAASRSEAALLPSLADEFFRLGVRNYVGAAWEVNDIGAELFATRLYDPCCPTQARRPQAQRSETPSLRRARRSPRRRRGSDHSGPPTSTTATRRAKHDSSKSASSAFSDDAVDVGGGGGSRRTSSESILWARPISRLAPSRSRRRSRHRRATRSVHSERPQEIAAARSRSSYPDPSRRRSSAGGTTSGVGNTPSRRSSPSHLRATPLLARRSLRRAAASPRQWPVAPCGRPPLLIIPAGMGQSHQRPDRDESRRSLEDSRLRLGRRLRHAHLARR